MFVLRSLFWLSAVVMILPASPDGKEPPPRVNFIHTAYAARDLLHDLSGICERNPDACTASREALTLLTRKIETGAEIVSAGIAASRGKDENGGAENIDHGTLTSEDLSLGWSVAAN